MMDFLKFVDQFSYFQITLFILAFGLSGFCVIWTYNFIRSFKRKKPRN